MTKLGIQSFEQDIKRIRASLGTLPALPPIGLSHGSLSNLDADDHPQYVHLSAPRSITGQHSFAPVSAQAPFTLGINAQGQLVAGLRADELNKQVLAGLGLTGGGLLTQDRMLNVGAGPGIDIQADSVGIALSGDSGLELTPMQLQMGTPGTLSVSSADAVTGASHTHAITASDNPGAATALLKSSIDGHLQLVRLGLGVAPLRTLQVQGATPQLQLQIDGAHTATIGVDSSDNLTLRTSNNLELYPVGDVIFDPAGDDILPLNNYDLNLGAINKKYLTLHAGELWVETLVAQETIATIGGRILVGPTTVLTDDFPSGATTLFVKHNQMAIGDRAYLEGRNATTGNPQVEFIAITGGPTAFGGNYFYTVTRNLDGSGANDWYAGDAVFNTGQNGSGFIDLYSLSGVKSGAGPTIAGNVRNSATYNDWTEHWAIGNLNGLYGYGADTFGAGFGKYSANNLVIDATNGIRFRNSTAVMGSLSSTTWTLGQAGEARVTITPTAINIYNGAASPVSQLLLNATGIYLRNTSGSTVFELSTSGNFFALPVTLGASGGIWQGTGTFASPTQGIKLYRSGSYGALAGYSSSLEQVRIGTDGKLWAGIDKVSLARNGLWLEGQGQNIIGIGGTGHVNFGNPTTQTVYGAIGSVYTNSTTYDIRTILTSTTHLTFSRTGSTYDVTLRANNLLRLQGANVLISGPASASSTFQVGTTLSVLGVSTLSGVNGGTFVRAAGYLVAGSHSVTANQGEVVALFRFVRRDGTTNYPGYIYFPMTTITAVYNATAVGSAGSANKTFAELGVPSAAKAVAIQLTFSSGVAGRFFYASPTNQAAQGVVCRTQVANVATDNNGIARCNLSGLYFEWSGAGTLYAYVLGYFI